jgi:hypothetical protein
MRPIIFRGRIYLPVQRNIETLPCGELFKASSSGPVFVVDQPDDKDRSYIRAHKFSGAGTARFSKSYPVLHLA